MQRVGGVERLLPNGVHSENATKKDLRGCEQGESGMLVVVVVPAATSVSLQEAMIGTAAKNPRLDKPFFKNSLRLSVSISAN